MEEQTNKTDKGGYEVAEEVTGMKRCTIYSKVSRREIPHYRIGRRHVVFSRSELVEWMKARRVTVAEARR